MSGNAEVDVCLIVPPFDAIDFPALGPSILVSACRAKGLRVELIHGSILLATRLGYDRYKAVCTTSLRKLLGERLFVPHAYPAEMLDTLGVPEELSERDQAIYDDISGELGLFLEELTARAIASRPRIVGISSHFQQNLASAALARRIRQSAPETCIVLGGANLAGPMAAGLAQVFSFVDYFFSGEADVEFPAFCERYIKEGRGPPEKVIDCAPISNMSVVYPPDFSSYFSDLRDGQNRGRLPQNLPNFLTMETSRGCWWGQKHHCTFCGLNAQGMEYRRKDADRVFDEIKDLSSCWKIRNFALADNIMPLSFLHDLLPALARWDERPQLFYEVKSNLREDQLQTMVRAGIGAIQPGIESFSSHVLGLMRKGVSGLQNVSLLRSCRSLGIEVGWNYLYGFPGEALEDYEDVLALLPQIEHLHPPTGCNPLIIDRFSPYFNTPEQFGIGKVKPDQNYYGLYPRWAPVAAIAFHFGGRYSTPLLADKECLEKLRAAVALWRQQWTPKRRPIVVAIDNGGDRVDIVDTRRIAYSRTAAVSREMDATLKNFERAKPANRLDGVTAEHVEYLLDRHFMVQHEGQLLSVVTRLHSIPVRSKSRPQPMVQLAAG